MKNKKAKTLCKKSISLLLTLLLVLTAVPLGGLTAFAAISGDFEYSILSEEDKTCEITKYTGSATTLGIPSKLDGYTVTSIGYGAFSNCTALTKINIPDSVIYIEDGAFYGCTAFTDISVAVNNPVYNSLDGVLFDKIQGELIQYPVGKTATIYTVPDNVKSIGYAAFHNAFALETIFIPDSVTSLGYSAFGNCTSLANITISKSITHIANSAFSNCKSLASITIPDSVTSIGIYAFEDCTDLMNIKIPDNVTNIEWYAFSNTGYYNTESNWENGVLYIGNYLIEANAEVLSGIQVYTVKQGTKTIAENAFQHCTDLITVSLPESITHIGNGAFKDCVSLQNITMPIELIYIGRSAFANCTSLSDIVIPPTVQFIDSYAFANTTITQLELYGGTAFAPDFDSLNYDAPIRLRVPFGTLSWFCAYTHNRNILYADTVPCVTPLDLPTVETMSSFDDVYPCPIEIFEDGKYPMKITRLQFIANHGSLNFEIEDIWAEYGTRIFLYDPQCQNVQELEFMWSCSIGVGGEFGDDGDASAITETVRYTAEGEISDLAVGNTYYLAIVCGEDAPESAKIKMGSYFDFADKSYILKENEPIEIYTQEKDTTYALAFTPSADGIYYLDGGEQAVLDSDGNSLDTQMLGYTLTAGKTYYFIVSHGVGQIGTYIPRRLQTENGFTYKISNGKAGIVSYEGAAQTVIVPETIGGYPVESFVLGYTSLPSITAVQSIIIPKSIQETAFGEYIFANYPNLKTIYSYSGTMAEAFAQAFGYTFIPLDVTETENGITVEFSPENPPAMSTALQVTQINDTDVQQTYDITLTDNGAPIQPAAPVTVKIPVPATMNGADCKVYRQEADGTYTDMQAVYKNGYMVFTTDHFSIYILTVKDLNAPEIAMGDLNNDGQITAVDARWALQAASGTRPLSDEQIQIADVNGDGQVTAVDARWILQAASGTRVL